MVARSVGRSLPRSWDYWKLEKEQWLRAMGFPDHENMGRIGAKDEEPEKEGGIILNSSCYCLGWFFRCLILRINFPTLSIRENFEFSMYLPSV